MKTLRHLVLTSILASSGLASDSNAIAGTWLSTDKQESMEFTSDGRVFCVTGPVGVAGRYEFPASGRIRLLFQGDKAPPPLELKYELRGDSLTLTRRDGKVTLFEKQPRKR